MAHFQFEIIESVLNSSTFSNNTIKGFPKEHTSNIVTVYVFIKLMKIIRKCEILCP